MNWSSVSYCAKIVPGSSFRNRCLASSGSFGLHTCGVPMQQAQVPRWTALWPATKHSAATSPSGILPRLPGTSRRSGLKRISFAEAALFYSFPWNADGIRIPLTQGTLAHCGHNLHPSNFGSDVDFQSSMSSAEISNAHLRRIVEGNLPKAQRPSRQFLVLQ